jgi:hypothetical protein
MRYSLMSWWPLARRGAAGAPEALTARAADQELTVDPWSHHEIDPRFPHKIRAVMLPDGTPYVEVVTTASGYRDRSDRPWLVIAADGETIRDENPMPPQAEYDSARVVIPTDRWIDQRTAGVAPEKLLREAEDYMTAEGWQGNDHGARRLAEWAAKYAGPLVLTLCSAPAERVFLDDDLTVILFPHPEYGPIAAVLYLNSGDEAGTYDLQLWRSTATAQQWTHWGDFDLHCPFGHVWHYRSEQTQQPDYVTDQDGKVYEHFDLWPEGEGYPAILTPAVPGSRDLTAKCPRCGSECTPCLATLRA